MVIVEKASESSWTFIWSDDKGQHAVAYLFEREKWVKRFRVRPGGWTDDQTIDLDLPSNEEHARRIAKAYIEG
jgi:hypothetical protein